jgi:hypothetical protein
VRTALEDGRPHRVGRRPAISLLDDEIADADRRWVQAHHMGWALVHRVDPHVGLTETDFAVIRQWLAQ